MAEGKSKSLWAHTSLIMALLAELHRDPKERTRPFSPADFNPHVDKQEKREKPPLKTVSMSELKELIPDLPNAMGGRR